MTKYNTKTVSQNVVTNHQGGTGIKLSPEMALITLLANGGDNTFYEKENERVKRLSGLIKEVAKKDKYLLAQMIVYTRAILGMRSITHRAAVEVAGLLAGEEWGKRFFGKWNRKEGKGGVIFRVDDMLEIAACYFTLNPDKSLPNSMKKGFKSAIENSDPYELSKYRGEGKNVKLIDLVNLVHPKGKKFNSEALKALVEGKLISTNTVEAKNTEAGKTVAAKVKSGEITQKEAEVELKEAKADNFEELIDTKKIGYLALLRNLRNILKADNKLVDKAGQLLSDRDFVRKSLVFPHQIDLALEVLFEEASSLNSTAVRKMGVYVDKAYEYATENVSELFNPETETAVVLDSSSSMTSGRVQGLSRGVKVIEKSCLIGATLAKGLKCDVYHFDYNCQSLHYNPNDSVNTIKNSFLGHCHGGNTVFESIFIGLNKAYDRVFIISDMQGGDRIINNSSYQEYKRKYNCDPYIYSIDLAGYGTTMFRENSKLCQLAGYSAQIYETAKTYELDPKALLAEIRKIVI